MPVLRRSPRFLKRLNCSPMSRSPVSSEMGLHNRRQKQKRVKLSDFKRRLIAYNQEWKCPGYFCNFQSILPPNFEIDHIQPLHLFGTNCESNLQAMCPTCHSFKTITEAPNEESGTLYYRKKRNMITVRMSNGETKSISLNVGKDNIFTFCVNLGLETKYVKKRLSEIFN